MCVVVVVGFFFESHIYTIEVRQEEKEEEKHEKQELKGTSSSSSFKTPLNVIDGSDCLDRPMHHRCIGFRHFMNVHQMIFEIQIAQHCAARRMWNIEFEAEPLQSSAIQRTRDVFFEKKRIIVGENDRCHGICTRL